MFCSNVIVIEGDDADLSKRDTLQSAESELQYYRDQFERRFEGRLLNSTADLVQDDYSKDLLFQMLNFGKRQNLLSDTIRELHSLTDQVLLIHEAPPALEEVHSTVPSLLAMLMESRERAKRVYRDALMASIEHIEFQQENSLFDELERELLRTQDILSLHPGRGSYH